MEIDWGKIYAEAYNIAASISNAGTIASCVKAAIKEYDRQLRKHLHGIILSEIDKRVGVLEEKFLISDYARRASFALEADKPETCDCEGRKKLQIMHILMDRVIFWDLCTEGGQIKTKVCPLCDKPLP